MAEADLKPDVHTFAALITTLARAGTIITKPFDWLID
jgi:hypothetical protein